MKKIHYWLVLSLLIILSAFNLSTLFSAINIGRKIEIAMFLFFSIVTVASTLIFVIKNLKIQELMLYSIMSYSIFVFECVFIFIYESNSNNERGLSYIYKESGNGLLKNGYQIILLLVLIVAIVMVIMTIILTYVVQNEKVRLYIKRKNEKKEIIKKLETLKHDLEMEKLNKEYEKLLQSVEK